MNYSSVPTTEIRTVADTYFFFLACYKFQYINQVFPFPPPPPSPISHKEWWWLTNIIFQIT